MSFWQDRPVLVTGATGLLGSWLVKRLLSEGADVVCLVRDWVPSSELVRSRDLERVRVVRGDVRDAAVIERTLGEYEVATAFHLAAQTIVGIANRNPVSTIETNVMGTGNMLEACRRSPVLEQLVVASSDKAYGDHGGQVYSEDSALRGRHPYDASKSCADLLSLMYAHTWGLPVCVTRCGNFFGGGDLNWNRIVPGTIRSVLRGTRPVIRSDGLFVRDYFYIEDAAAAYMLLAEKMAERPEIRGEAFNFSNENRVSVLDLVVRILALMGSHLEPEIRNEASNEIPAQCLDASKARRELGWTPLFGLDEGLRTTIAWYTEHLADEQRG